jgi:divalent metal cation (Fe/Co/Zn/Cd) transporter
VWLSLAANFSLAVLQSWFLSFLSVISISFKPFFGPVYAAISSVSFSLLATGIDAIFDLGSNVLLFWLHKKATRLDINKWPVGGARLETIGNIVYGVSPIYVEKWDWCFICYRKVSCM